METWTIQELSKKLAADTATRAGLNTNRLGHHRIALLTPLHMHALLALLTLPSVMPASAVHALFADISNGGSASAAAVKDALRPFAQPPPRGARTESAQDVAIIQALMVKADSTAAAAESAAADADSDGGSVAVRDSAAVPEPPPEAKKKGAKQLYCSVCHDCLSWPWGTGSAPSSSRTSGRGELVKNAGCPGNPPPRCPPCDRLHTNTLLDLWILPWHAC